MNPVHSAPPAGRPKLLEAPGKVYSIKDYISEGSIQKKIGEDINNNVGTKLLENTLKTESKVNLVFPGDPGYRSVDAAQFPQQSFNSRKMIAIDLNGEKIRMKSRFNSGLGKKTWYLPGEIVDAYEAKGIYKMDFRLVVGGEVFRWKSSSKSELYSESVTVSHQVRDKATPQIPKVKKKVRFQLDNESVSQLDAE